MTSIVVFGGNGYAGGHIATEATSRGLSVTSVSRSDGSTGRAGSVTDPELVAELAQQADVLVVAVPAQAALESVNSLIATAIANGSRLAVVGGAGSLLVSPDGPRLVDTPDFHEEWKAEALAHAQVLDALRDAPAELDWFYLSPAALFGAWTPGEATGSYRSGTDVLLTDADGKSEISGVDFALAFVDEIVQPAHSRSRFTVAH
ncbi:MAG: NAD(P)H-binding protein [Actinomycetota bacterium]|nr:NAD(P)H-binding protein [Actinomycetota bacterium]